MRTIIEDDRTDQQKLRLTQGVVARDKFMSGWGGAAGGDSYAAWVATPEADKDKLFRWVEQRNDMARVAWRDLSKYRPPQSCKHFHIYVADVSHPSQGE